MNNWKRAVLALIVFSSFAPLAMAARSSRPAGKHRVRVLRSWTDTIKVSGRDVPRRVEIVFDYTDAVGYERSYDLRGRLTGTRSLAKNPPRPSEEEFNEAVAIVRTDAELGPVMARISAIPDGGFLLEEAAGKACGPGTRCVQILWLSENRFGLVRRVVVDLVNRSILYRSYTPTEGGL